MSEKLLSAVEVAEAFGYRSTATIRRWVAQGCPFERHGSRGHYRFTLSAVRQWWGQRAGAPAGSRLSVLEQNQEAVLAHYKAATASRRNG